MILIDTSSWIDLLRDGSGRRRRACDEVVQDEDIVLARFVQLELLQGAANEREWSLLAEALDTQRYLEAGPETWPAAARIYFELRRQGLTVRSPVDCCIAQLALDHDALLLHRDRDFATIGRIRPLRQRFLTWPDDAPSG